MLSEMIGTYGERVRDSVALRLARLNLNPNFLTLFGLGPLILFLVFKKKRMALLREAPLWVLVSLGYGLLSFFITPIMATEPFRLAGYGWPAFWVAAPFLFRNHLYKGTKETVKILALHLLLAYLPTLLSVATESLSVHRLLVLGGTFLIYRTAWETLRESHSEDTVSSGRS